ncbi:MAG: Gfo/Idh/MocA family protein [Paracoccaceae bacterium]
MNIALIGIGMVAGTHVAAVKDSSGLTLSGVLGRDIGKVQVFAQKIGASKVYRDASEVATDRTVDFAIIATPPDQRRDLVEQLSAAGKPILMEKPIERTLDAATEIVSLCAQRDVCLGIVFQHRARAASQALKSALANGVLGDVVSVELRVPWWRDQAYYDAPGRGSYARDGGGAMINQAIHTLDLLLWLLGPMSEVQALMTTTDLHEMEAEDWAAALFRMECGAVGSLMATTSAFPGGSESVTMHGTRAVAHLADGVLTLTDLGGRVETFGAEAATGGGADPMAFTHAWHQTVIEDFAAALRSGSDPLATGRSALMAHAVIAAMEEASRTRQMTKVPRV